MQDLKKKSLLLTHSPKGDFSKIFVLFKKNVKHAIPWNFYKPRNVA